jgi:hypothetical protein
MPQIFYDKVRLGFGQSLVIGHKPENLDLAIIGQGHLNGTEINKFGLFETATPNFHTYYPEVKAEDLKPKDSDYVKPIFRALSEVIVHKRRNPIDFSLNGILKASMNKLVGQTVYANHEAVVGNEVGVVSNVQWQESYITNDGITVPAGINAEFMIDGKAHPNIARNIMMTPPAIHSNSVTVEFAWEKSHSKMSDDEFWSMLGKNAKDGQMVRRVVSEVARYHETSLVAHGADPFAQKVVDGKIVNPEYAQGVYSLSAQGKERAPIYFFSYKEDITSLSEDTRLPESNNINSTTDTEVMDEHLIKIGTLLSLSEGATADSIMEAITKLSEKANSLTEKETKIKELEGTIQEKETALTNLTVERDNLKTKATLADQATAKLKAEVVRLHGVLEMDATLLPIIENSNYEALEAFQKTFDTQVSNKFPAQCTKCGSADVTRMTTKPEGTTPGNSNNTKSLSDISAELKKENRGSFISTKS